jgi:hypothetical protein
MSYNTKVLKKSIKNEYTLNKLSKKIFKKLYNWWYKIASSGFYIVNKNNKVIFSKNKVEEIDDIKYIIWVGQSTDSLTFFINYILQKLSINKIEEFISTKNISSYLIIDNFKIFFNKSKIYTNKEYTLNSLEEINEKKIINKLKKSDILNKYL